MPPSRRPTRIETATRDLQYAVFGVTESFRASRTEVLRRTGLAGWGPPRGYTPAPSSAGDPASGMPAQVTGHGIGTLQEPRRPASRGPDRLPPS